MKRDVHPPAPLPPSNCGTLRARTAPLRLFGKIARLSQTFVRGIKLADEALTYLWAVLVSVCGLLCALILKKRLPSEAQLSMRALILALRSVKESVRSSAARKGEGLNKATLG